MTFILEMRYATSFDSANQSFASSGSRCFLLVDEYHVLINPLALHILPMPELLPRHLLQTPPVTSAAFVDTVHEALPSRRATGPLAPRIDRQRQQSVLPQQRNGSIHSLERQVPVPGTQSGADDHYI